MYQELVRPSSLRARDATAGRERSPQPASAFPGGPHRFEHLPIQRGRRNRRQKNVVDDDANDLANVPEDVRANLAEIDASTRPKREKVVSEQKPPRKKIRKKGGEPVDPTAWERERVHAVERASPTKTSRAREATRDDAEREAHERRIEAVQTAIGQLREQRTARKRDTTAEVFEKRKAFAPGASRRDIEGSPGGPNFLDDLFGESGRYMPEMQSTDLTSERIVARANRLLTPPRVQGKKRDNSGPRLKAVNSGSSAQSHVTFEGERLFTLHRGATAFERIGAARDSGRGVVRKKGSDTEFVLDDRGQPTRRFAYAVKSGYQMSRMGLPASSLPRTKAARAKLAKLRHGEALEGRFMSSGHTVFGNQPRDLDSASHTELATLGRRGPRGKPFGTLSRDEMLYMHQEFGSGERQRGVSIAGTPRPLLSNEARGFAEGQIDPRKMRIDLSTVPRTGKHENPNLVNFHARFGGMESRRVKPPALHVAKNIPLPLRQEVPPGAVGGERKALLAERRAAYRDAVNRVDLDGNAVLPIVPGPVLYSQAQNAKRWDWSVGKNRELFLRKLGKRNLKGVTETSDLERMTYSHMDRRAIRGELARVEDEARQGEATIPKIALKPARAKTRKRRKGPSNRKG